MMQGIDIGTERRERTIDDLTRRAEREGLDWVLLSIGQRGNHTLRAEVEERLQWISSSH